MYVDNELLISDAQSVAGNGNFESTDAIDLETARDVGTGCPLYMVAVLGGVPDQDIEVKLTSDDDGAGTGLVEHASIGSFASGAPAGTTLCAAIPSTDGSLNEMKQFMRARFSTTAVLTATPIDVFFTTTPQKYKAYPKGYTITG